MLANQGEGARGQSHLPARLIKPGRRTGDTAAEAAEDSVYEQSASVRRVNEPLRKLRNKKTKKMNGEGMNRRAP